MEMIVCQLLNYSLSRRNMHLLNKSTSLPAFSQNAPETLGSKPRKQNIQDLENEVNKSRIAIENMSHTRAINSNLYKRVAQLQKELHHCILNINHESQKQNILSDLICVLKGEMSEVQAVQRTSEEVMSCSFEKKIKKVEYDIKQLLHKYNEEIAKINWLKEQANAARDERVVYSNLFNKIQKEIKHYEELYKQTLIKNQIFLDKKRSHSIKTNHQHTHGDPIEEAVEYLQNGGDLRETQPAPSRKEIKLKQNKKSIKSSDKSQQQEFFITNLKDSISKQQGDFYLKDMSSTNRLEVTTHRGIESLIREKQCIIESIIVKAQCRSLDEVLSLYNSIEQNNQNLVLQITQQDQKIAQLQEEIQRQQRQKRTSEVYENRQLTQMFNISKKSRANKAAVEDSETVGRHSLVVLTKKICQILGVESENLGNDVLKEMDRRVEQLGCKIVQHRGRKESRLFSFQELGVADRGVSDLLDKIDRFGESQKIFDRNMLKAEYQKEINKVRKRGKKTS